jgi:hypothetical protein
MCPWAYSELTDRQTDRQTDIQLDESPCSWCTGVAVTAPRSAWLLKVSRSLHATCAKLSLVGHRLLTAALYSLTGTHTLPRSVGPAGGAWQYSDK